MPVELHEDLIELEIETLSTAPFERSVMGPSYPHTRLVRTGSRRTVSLRTVVLENEFLSATVVVDLGGRLHSLREKRAGVEVLPCRSSLPVHESGPRSAWIESGLQVVAGQVQRLNSLGPVDVLVREPDDPMGAGSVVLHELVPGLGLSWHATYSLAPDRAELDLDFRMFNRGFLPTPGASGIRCAFPGGCAYRLANGVALDDRARDAGVVLSWDEGAFEGATWLDESLTLLSDGLPDCELGPRMTASWSLRIAPITGLGSLEAASDGLAAGVTEGRLRLRSARSLEGCKLHLMGGTGESLEAPTRLAPGQVEQFELTGPAANPVRWLLRAAGQADLMSWDRETQLATLEDRASWVPIPLQESDEREGVRSRAYREALHQIDEGNDPTPWLSMATRDPRTRPAALVLLAMRSLGSGDAQRANDLLEDALGSNSEDALAWWLKAACQRRLGASDDRPELLNAHYLAPLEPALRAEALLSQKSFAGDGANPVLEPLREDPEALVEVACLLLDAGLRDDAALWLDESLRLRDDPILHLLSAWNHLSASGMETEAAIHVSAAGRRPIAPPFPWRDLERRALRDLAERFPSDQRIRMYLEWMSDIPR